MKSKKKKDGLKTSKFTEIGIDMTNPPVRKCPKSGGKV